MTVASVDAGVYDAQVMKLKLRTQSTETLKTCLSQFGGLRKFAVLRFSPQKLSIISVDTTSIALEPQLWCNVKMLAVFSEVYVQSIRDNVISLELNTDLLLQALRNFEKASSHELSIRLQRKDLAGEKSNLRNASLALGYADSLASVGVVSHLFQIPVKILKGGHEISVLKEPELRDVDLLVRLPSEFHTTFKRLDKFKKLPGDLVTIMASRRKGGYMAFVLEELGKYKVTLAWNKKLETRKPQVAHLDSDAIREAILRDGPGDVDEENSSEDKRIAVRLKDWRAAAKVMAGCHTVVFALRHREACALHCLLDDSDDVQITYYVSGLQAHHELD